MFECSLEATGNSGIGSDAILPAFPGANIPVFLGCDDNYFHHAMTVVASIVRHASSECNYDVLIIQDRVPEEKLRRAVEWAQAYSNVSVRFVDCRAFMEADGSYRFPTSRHITVASYFRIFAPVVFGRYDKILYLDSDVVCLGDVGELYRQELDGCALGACHDLVNEQQSMVDDSIAAYWSRELGKTPGEVYFNAGVLVMDLARMRAMNALAAMLEKMRGVQDLLFHDQDVLNSVFNGTVKYLDHRWNLQDWMVDADERAPLFGYIGENHLKQLRDARKDCRIIHFTHAKPWSALYFGVNDDLYWQYASQSPFYEELMMKFLAECHRKKPLLAYLVSLLQAVNFRSRLCVASPQKKRKYRERLGWLSLRRRRFLNLMRRSIFL